MQYPHRLGQALLPVGGEHPQQLPFFDFCLLIDTSESLGCAQMKI
jgi:hypothetical protein